MTRAILTHRKLGVVAALPVQPQKYPIPLHGRDDLHQYRSNDAFAAFRAGSLVRPSTFEIGAQRETLLAFIGTQRVVLHALTYLRYRLLTLANGA